MRCGMPQDAQPADKLYFLSLFSLDQCLETGDAAAERRTWTLSDANINRDVPAYADAAGHLYAVLPIGSPAGADAYEQVLALDVGA